MRASEIDSGLQQTKTNTKENMSDLHSKNIEEVLRESMDNYEKALKTGIKLQEETMNVWKDVLQKLGSPEQLQAKLKECTADLFPTARKQMEEIVATLSRTSDQVLSLSEKTVSVCKAPTLQEAQHGLQDLAESYFAAARENLKIAFDVNTQVIGYWSDRVGQLVPVAK